MVKRSTPFDTGKNRELENATYRNVSNIPAYGLRNNLNIRMGSVNLSAHRRNKYRFPLFPQEPSTLSMRSQDNVGWLDLPYDVPFTSHHNTQNHMQRIPVFSLLLFISVITGRRRVATSDSVHRIRACPWKVWWGDLRGRKWKETSKRMARRSKLRALWKAERYTDWKGNGGASGSGSNGNSSDRREIFSNRAGLGLINFRQ